MGSIENNCFKEIHGVTFFNSSSSCISNFESMHWGKRTISFLQSFGELLLYVFHKVSLLVNRIESHMKPLTDTQNNPLSKRKLVVCIHGLNNNPTQFKSIVDNLQKRALKDTDIFVPYVLQKGNATLDRVVRPILQEIIKWAKTHPEKELVLVGVSNGARIARAIETELAKSNHSKNIKKLSVVSIVGAWQGSSLAHFVNTIGLSCLLPKEIAEEMPTGSQRNAALNREWREGLTKTPAMERNYTFIASPHDWQVPNYDSTLPDVSGQRARYALLPGHGHNSIVNAAASAVAEIVASA